ncbi:hypothetical protein HYW41_01180, partial [Candidatus Daviesbacteria bacterium]|nr:hypothetical protein [Candidatus Daviesbacteria bacterium]
ALNPLSNDAVVNFCISTNPDPWVRINGDVYAGTTVNLPPAPPGAIP